MPSGVFSLKQVNQALVSGAWSNQKPVNVDYLVVAGGGGASRGGGGAGGLLQGNIAVIPATSYTVTVGAGGAGTAIAGAPAGNNGSNSVFGSITSTGGGGGGAGDYVGQSGGSGGGTGASGAQGTWAAGQGIFGQGNAGGTNNNFIVSPYPSGGGGGAGTAGLSASEVTISGNGGTGISSDISGTRTAYAGGGGGANYSGSGTAGVGGAGGGGNGIASGANGTSGTANTGGGGGGAANGYTGGSGGSGIVIISYPDIYQAAASTTGSPTVSTSGSGSILFVRSSSQYLAYPNSSSQFSFGTGAFTIECWVRLVSMPAGTGYPASYWLFGGGPVNSNLGIDFYINSTQIGFNLVDFTSPTVIGNHGMSINTWYHVAVVRGGSGNQTMSIYVAGTRVATASGVTATADASTTGIAISAAEPTGATSGNLDGYISNHRIVKGAAVYDPTQSTITVPTAPLTAITNTQLLLNTNSGAFTADSSTNALYPNSLANTTFPAWNSLSPFTVTGYKNRVYTWTSSGSITF